MEIKIIDDKENKLFNRREILGFVEAEIVPSRAEVLDIISKKFSVPADNIKIKKISGSFGSKKFEISANIYSSKEDRDAIEIKKKKDIELEKKTAEPEPQTDQVQSQPEAEAKTREKIEEPKPADEKPDEEAKSEEN